MRYLFESGGQDMPLFGRVWCFHKSMCKHGSHFTGNWEECIYYFQPHFGIFQQPAAPFVQQILLNTQLHFIIASAGREYVKLRTIMMKKKTIRF